MKSKTTLIGMSCGAGTAIIALYVIFPLLNTPDYGVEIDAIKVRDLVAISTYESLILENYL